MKTIKTIALISLFSIILFGFDNAKRNHQKFSFKNSNKDSIWVFKSETLKAFKLDYNKNEDSVVKNIINYHIINFSTSKITLFTFDSKEKKWKNKSFEYYSTLEGEEKIQFNPDPNICQKVSLDRNPFKSIKYSFNDSNTYIFSNIKKIENDSLEKLGIYKLRDSYEFVEHRKKIVIKEHIKNFEYSEHWKTESYKKVIEYMKQTISKDDSNCKMVSRSYYNTNLVQYIGNQGYRVKIYCEFDCNQNYINQSYFWIEAYYLGFGKWDLELVDQKLTH